MPNTDPMGFEKSQAGLGDALRKAFAPDGPQTKGGKVSEENDDLNLIETMAENLNMQASAADAEDFEANVAMFTKSGIGAILERVAKQWRDVRERLAAAERERNIQRERIAILEDAVSNNTNIALLEATRAHMAKADAADLLARLTRAEADGAAMRRLLEDAKSAMQSNGCDPSSPPSWQKEHGRVIECVSAALASDHPGADLLAVVEAARKWQHMRKVRASEEMEYHEKNKTYTWEDEAAAEAALSAALATYDARVQEGK